MPAREPFAFAGLDPRPVRAGYGAMASQLSQVVSWANRRF
jgi:hypothetical protein